VCAAGPARGTTRQEGGAWVIENAAIRVRIDPAPGTVQVTDKRAGGRTWSQPTRNEGAWLPGPAPRYRNGRALPPPADGVAFDSDIGGPKNTRVPLTVTFSVPADSALLAVAADTPDHDSAMATSPFMNFFLLDAPRGVLAVAYQSNGQLYPLNAMPTRALSFDTGRLDMPWFGVTDLAGGAGYMVLLDTPADGMVHCDTCRVGGRPLAVPRLAWQPSLGRFGYARRFECRFFVDGGYVAQALAYREVARAQGLLVTLADKARANPEVAKLLGAVDIWGGNAEFARAARAAGVGTMLLSGDFSAGEAGAIDSLGCLAGIYDNYCDIMPIAPGGTIDAGHDSIPAHVVMQADGSRMSAHLDWASGKQWMKRCPSFWQPAARAAIPPDLRARPFTARFIDVITAESPYECFDPAHPVTRTDYAKLGAALLGYVGSLHQVVGGEMGIWWAVPDADYFEGMMSGGYRYYAWPAGQLMHPRTKDERFSAPGNASFNQPWSEYARWGIGFASRVPLWELVFHDCVVSTWYWGDSNDWLLEAAPELTARKDLFNILYGTMPLLWAGRPESGWMLDRAAFLRTARTVAPVFAALGGAAMVSHQFVTADGAVQRTRFSNGAEVVANFGASPYDAAIGGATHRLPENGFAVVAPGFTAFRELTGGREVTTVGGRAIE